MATAAVLPAPRDVHTSFRYLKRVPEQVPYYYVNGPPEGVPRTNIETEEHDAVVNDVRGKEDTVSLDKTGFQFVKHVSAEKEFRDEERIKNVYYKEVEEILKKYTGAKRVFVFDHTIRRDYEKTLPGESAAVRGPVKQVHVDQTFGASVARVRHHLPDEADRLLKSRVRIINVWRPIEHTVAHDPLGVADYFSLDVDNDLIPCRHIYPDREGGTFAVAHNPSHRWYYLSDQTTEEVTLIKCFDSDTDKARLTPHSSFKDTGSPASAPPRQSIEVRSLVFDAE